MIGRRGTVSGLVRLYPAAWRDRYEEEFLALLEARPPTLGDRFDIVRGAVDARLHPQVHRPDAPVPDGDGATGRVIARGLGFGAIAGAGIWLAGWVIAMAGPVIVDGEVTYHDAAAAFPLFLLAIGLLVAGLVGQLIVLPSAARLARIGATLAVPFLVMWSIAPWYPTEYVVASAGLLSLAVGAVRAGAWSARNGAAVVLGLTALTATILLAFAGLIGLPQELSFVVAGLAGACIWLGIGGSLVAGTAPVHLRPA